MERVWNPRNPPSCPPGRWTTLRESHSAGWWRRALVPWSAGRAVRCISCERGGQPGRRRFRLNGAAPAGGDRSPRSGGGVRPCPSPVPRRAWETVRIAADHQLIHPVAQIVADQLPAAETDATARLRVDLFLRSAVDDAHAEIEQHFRHVDAMLRQVEQGAAPDAVQIGDHDIIRQRHARPGRRGPLSARSIRLIRWFTNVCMVIFRLLGRGVPDYIWRLLAGSCRLPTADPRT